ncbi:valine--tRNA ligase, chloroplastic/mitochondrial 2 isoform X1 [Tanacetum coccineum]|uniref:valine--tRNA ligase n=1 Tax=Tanacetum coccineum TaxID=301880 RepID=A0ABQ5AJ23_9ASTR
MRSTALTASFAAAKYIIRVSPFFGVVRVGNSDTNFFISRNAASAASVHLKSFLLVHFFNVSKKGRDRSADLDKKQLRAASFPLRDCIYLRVFGDGMPMTAFAFSGLTLIPSEVTRWDSQGHFKPSFDKGNESFVVTMPPPNVTGSLHMGHAMFVTHEDIMIRYNRMNGRPTLWLPGTDHAGIATQLVVERMLASEGIKRTELGREEFTKRVWEWKEKYGGMITNQIRRLGASCDWTREHFTLDEQLSRAVIEAFIKLHEKGLIYQGSYMVNWSPNLQTAVCDLEVEYSEEPGALYHIKYLVAGGSKSDFLTVATTRPETLFGDTAVAVNPEDERYAKYIGKSAIVPMTFGRHVPIIADKLDFPILTVMNKDGTLNEVAGLYNGLDRFEARKKLWAELEETGLAVKKEAHTSRVPRSQRGGEIIEPLVSKQWFVTMEPLAEKALEAVKTGELTIMPERFDKIYNHWLLNIKDWCISRQLWWGHRIPVWYIVGKDPEEDYIVARSTDEALKQAQQKYGKNVEIYQDPDVLDTWFSSSLWPFSTLGWPDVSADDFKRFYPTSVLETGHDILFFWVARMVMMGIEFTGTVPFTHVYLHGLIRDSQGRKMSKTLGNVIDPLDTIKEFGTDALRFTLALGTVGQDLNLSTERLTSNKAFTNKLWNAGKFVLQNLPDRSDASAWETLLAHKFDKEEHLLGLPLPEYWVVSKLHVLVDAVTTSYDKYFYNDVAREMYDFFWGDFADWYIEASKAHLYQSEDQALASTSQAVLLYVYENILKMLHPFMPFVTEELWQALPNRKEALIVSPWPLTSLPRNLTTIKRFENLQALTRAIRNVRAEYSVEPAKRISASIVANTEVIQYISRFIEGFTPYLLFFIFLNVVVHDACMIIDRSWKSLQQNLRFLNMVSRAKGSCNRTIHDSTIIQESNLRFLKKTRTWMPIKEDVELKEKSDHHRHLSRRRKPPDETKKIRTPQGEELKESPHK